MYQAPGLIQNVSTPLRPKKNLVAKNFKIQESLRPKKSLVAKNLKIPKTALAARKS